MSKPENYCPTWVEPLNDDDKLRTDGRIRSNLLRHAQHYAVTYDQCFAHQSDVTHSMRSILLCWLRDVCAESHLVDDTYTLACSLVDRHSAVAELKCSYYQLVGSTCLLIASKLRDPSPIETPEIVQYTVRTVTREQLFDYEQLVVSSLQFDLESVTAWDLVCYTIRLFVIPNMDDEDNESYRRALRCYAKKFVYAIASEKVYLDFSPPVIAASTIAFALESIKNELDSVGSSICLTFAAEACELLQTNLDQVKSCLAMIALAQRDSASSNPALNDLPAMSSLQLFSQPAYAAASSPTLSPLLNDSNANARISMSSDMSAGSACHSFVREEAFLHSSPFSCSPDKQTRHVSFAVAAVSIYEDDGNESAGRSSAAVTPSKRASLLNASSGYVSLDEKENVKASEAHFVVATASSPQSSVQ